ncbi:MAG: sigma 54-interacting transcriptional regulator [Phycisphaerales bacterium]
MESLEQVAWKAAARHAGLTDFVVAIAGPIARSVGVRGMTVRHLSRERDAATTLASVERRASRDHGPERGEVTRTARRRLERWLRDGKLVSWPNDELRDAGLGPLVPERVGAGALVGPLRADDGTCGVLVLEPDGERFSVAQRGLLEPLRAAFATALANDVRHHEQERLREAAEADRASLLRRLGRLDLADEVVGRERGLRLVMERVELVARADVPVLILGETGAGKEVVARSVHQRSARASAPFVRVNCGAIPAELVDSELFGHERGAFTGATSERRGWFEQADGGTLFLDEVGELPLAAQVRLLRVLQDGTLTRVGGEQPIRVDVRVVAATHRDLPSLVQQRTFRQDLWYRIAVFPILLPPLRDHPEDIADLAEHFARRAARRFGLAEILPGPEDIEALLAYDWPGNVRELASVIDRAVILGRGERLEVAAALGQPHARPSDDAGPRGVAPTRAVSSLDDAIRRHVEQALTITRGRIEGPDGAARLLGINPHTLRARMRKLGVRWAKFRA